MLSTPFPVEHTSWSTVHRLDLVLLVMLLLRQQEGFLEKLFEL